MASITRAFSTRPRTTSTQKHTRNILSQSNSMRQQGIKISAPVLVSTTNAQTLHSRDVSTAIGQKQTLRKVSSVSSHSSVNSDGHSDHSSIPSRSRGASFTDNSSVGSSPSSPKTDNSNGTDLWGLRGHPSPRKAKSSANLKERAAITETIEPVPAIPRSHTLSQQPPRIPVQSLPLNRKQSLQTLPTASWQPSMPQQQPRQIPKSVPEPESLRQTRTSPDIFRSHQIGSPHPFSKELRQLDQVAEEYRDAAFQEDTELMQQRGLHRFCADDYIRDLQPCFFHYFMPQPVTVGWI